MLISNGNIPYKNIKFNLITSIQEYNWLILHLYILTSTGIKKTTKVCPALMITHHNTKYFQTLYATNKDWLCTIKKNYYIWFHKDNLYFLVSRIWENQKFNLETSTKNNGITSNLKAKTLISSNYSQNHIFIKTFYKPKQLDPLIYQQMQKWYEQ